MAELSTRPPLVLFYFDELHYRLVFGHVRVLLVDQVRDWYDARLAELVVVLGYVGH